MTAQIRSGRHRVEISHPEKVMFADPPVTKLELAEHYERVGPAMLPHVRNRALALEVFPSGTGERGFFVKKAPAHFPDWVHTAEVPKKGGTNTQVVGSPIPCTESVVTQWESLPPVMPTW